MIGEGRDHAMNIFTCYKKGVAEASLRPRVVLILWAVNAAFASLAFLLFSGYFGAALGSSTAAAGLMKQPDMNIIFEMLNSPGGGLGMLRSGLLLLILLFCLFSFFVNGGILEGLFCSSRDARRGRTFFEGGAIHYWRFLKLAIYSLVLWVPACLIFALSSGLLMAATRGSIKEQLTFCLRLGLGAFILFLVYIIMMIMDYARIRIVAEDTGEVFRSLARSTAFVFKHIGSSLGIYYLLGATGLAVFGVWRLFIHIIPQTSMAGVWTAFLFTQLFIASRGWLRIAFQSAQTANFKAHRPVVSVPAEQV